MTQAPCMMFTDDPPAIVVGRSELDRWGRCPHQAAVIEAGFVSTGGEAADAGSGVHDVLGEACRLRREDGADAREIRAFIEDAAASSRPDIQPLVVEGMRRSAYGIAEILCSNPTASQGRAPEDVIRYDGGAGEHSGQIAADILPASDDESRGPVRLTCEVDLLMATESPEELLLVDWKAGNTHWTATDVKRSFQFSTYAYLLFRNYPTVNRVRVIVYMTREAASTSAVEFDRARDFYSIQKRLISTVNTLLQYRGEPVENVPAWPSPDKCATCDAALRCKLAHQPAAEVARDPEGAVRQLVVLEEAAGRLKASLSVAVRQAGRDFDFGDVAFGSNKPKAARAEKCDVYTPA